jgi:uncharacterized protein YaiE (UPF0345 family)
LGFSPPSIYDDAGEAPALPVKAAKDMLAPHSRRCDDVSFMSSLPTQFANVTVTTKANVYFNGNVVSHTVLFADGSKKTLGLIYPGSYHFGTDAAERMEIVAGNCSVVLDGKSEEKTYSAGQYFDVPAKSGFTIKVSALTEYICSFIA